MDWTEAYFANFGRLSADEAAAFSGEFRAQLGSPTNAELLKAVQQLGARWPIDGYPPKARHIVSEVKDIRAHESSRQSQRFEHKVGCVYCGGSGWMRVPVSVKKFAIVAIGHLPGHGHNYQQKPCMCQDGQRIKDIAFPDADGQKLLMAARKAARTIDKLPDHERAQCVVADETWDENAARECAKNSENRVDQILQTALNAWKSKEDKRNV